MTIDKLMEKYPDLLPPGLHIDCGAGWLPILDHYLAVVEREVADGTTFEVQRIREYMGVLTITDTSFGGSETSATTLAHTHALAEARSLSTCEVCGTRGQMRSLHAHLSVRCDGHADGGDVVYPQPQHYRETDDGWTLFDPDADAFLPTEAPEWAR
nr:hypothetical protein RKHAN_02507 [Rhizobium sp. Khangiran2]